MPGKLSNTLALLLVCHTAALNLMSAPRVGSLKRLEEEGTAGDLGFESSYLSSLAFTRRNYLIFLIEILFTMFPVLRVESNFDFNIKTTYWKSIFLIIYLWK